MGGDHRRFPRVRQKGVECSVEGCTDWCVGNDLCSKHNMQKHRLTEKGKAYVKEYNKRYKRPNIKKVCVHCERDFITARTNQELCSECSPSQSKAKALKRYRKKNIKKVRIWGRVSKRAARKHPLAQECSIDGCDKIGERHHPNYSKPLDIVWLCKEHHGHETVRLRKISKELINA